MNKTDLLIGFVIGIIVTLLGSFLFITCYTEFDFITGINIIKSQGHLGKIITIGCIPNLIAFGLLLKLNKELMARGIVLTVLILTILTIFI